MMTVSADPQTPLPPDEQALAALVAARLAALRRDRGLSFDALAQAAGLAKGTLVQIEQGRANPAISTLCRLAAALHVSVADLVAEPGGPEAVTAVPPADARQLWTGPQGGRAVLMAGTPGPDMLELWHWHLYPGERFQAQAHGRGTREILHVLTGTLDLIVEGRLHRIAAGASALARTDRPHAYANAGPGPLTFSMTVHEPPAGA